MSEQDRNDLRQKAMERMSRRHGNVHEMGAGDLAATLHDLELYQAELEVQNEELRRTQLELEAAKDRYRDLYEFAPVAYLTADADGRIRQANLTLTRMTGLPRNSLVGKLVEPLFVLDDRNMCTAMRNALGTGSQSGDLRLQLGARADKWVHVEMSRLTGGDALRPDFRMTLTDISAQKQAEESLRQLARELERSNMDLEQFAFVASHDLQEPLRMIVSFLALLRQRAGGLDDKSREFVDFAVDGASRMSQMVQDLLEYSRIDSKGHQFKSISARSALMTAMANLDTAIRESSGSVTHDEMPTVTADPQQLARLFQNLIANALKFRSENRRPEVHVSAQRKDNGWLFKVIDNGIGMEPDQTGRIFQIFQRLHTRVEYPGTGIGLAICKRIVERHGGRIWAESSPGEGSTFCFTIPDR